MDFSLDEARVSAEKMKDSLHGRKVVFVGRFVSLAFGIKLVPYCRWIYSDRLDCCFSVLPHPSGIVRWWNDPNNVNLASSFLQEIFKSMKEEKNEKISNV